MKNALKALLWLFLTVPFIVFWRSDDPNVYTVDISQPDPPVISDHLKLGTNKNAKGEELDANSLFFTKNGKPWYPVMGEIHFSRYPKAQWEESILKMKAAGINVIASYIIWIHHEEEEGKLNWAGNNNLRAFAELCRKHKVYFFARVGPWVHGEVRNGGFPDWVVKRGNVRKNDPVYLASVKKFYTQIGKQLSGLYFKNGGPVIGAQIENEYRFNNPAGLEHMLGLKKMAIDAGIDVPFYTATGWPGSNQKQDEIIPVWGAYPEAPWDKKTTQLALSPNYLFDTLRNDPAIGSDLLGQHVQQNYKGYRYPYATAEMGGGNQITYHRRPIIEANDVTALTYVKVGSGANLMGYYMFHGGSNPIGKRSTLQESKATKYPNDYPIISYDFLSPLGEWGQLRPSYHGFKVIHTFLNEFGEKLVQANAFFPDKQPSGPADKSTLRMSVRAKDNRGFVFISNFQRQLEMEDAKKIQIELTLKGGSKLRFPETPFAVRKNLQMVMPFNMDLDGLNLNYTTAQPLCRLEAEEPVYVFFAPEGIKPEYSFMRTDINIPEVSDAVVNRIGSTYIVKTILPGTDCTMRLTLANGKVVKIITLDHVQALNAWKADIFGAERLFISSRDLIFYKDKIRFQHTASPEIRFSVYPALSTVKFSEGVPRVSRDGVFSGVTLQLPLKVINARFKEVKNIKPFSNKGKMLPKDDRDVLVNTAASPGPQYQTNLRPVQGSRYYEIYVPKSSLTGVSDAFITLDYTGDTGSAYLNGKLIADDFYSGLPMTISIKRFSSLPGKKMLFQIVPLTDERRIYFEKGVREPLTGKNAAELNSLTIIPQYEVFVSSGK